MNRTTEELLAEYAAGNYWKATAVRQSRDGSTRIVVSPLNLPGCFGVGSTQQEAEADLEDVLLDFLRGMAELVPRFLSRCHLLR